MPIIGNGDIASVLKDRLGITFLASGLSNSSNVTYADFCRERNLIERYRNNHVVYFSSLCIYYSDSDYAKYKRELEAYVIQKCNSYTIVRIGNISWGKNPNTLLNYMKAHPEAERRDETRYIVDKEEFLHWIDKIRPYTNDIMNIPGKRINANEL
jgi:uncharacterized protein YbjT (DUF2867 family)